MLNKPKYTLFKNGRYALNGLIEVSKNESSFKLQLVVFVVFGSISWLLPIDFVYSFILFSVLFVPIMAELTNSAIERVVDMVTKDYHVLAMNAKDAGSALVLISLIFAGFVWLGVLYINFIR